MIFTICINRKIDKHEMPLNICFNWIQFFRCETNITVKNLVVIQLQAKGYNMDHKIKHKVHTCSCQYHIRFNKVNEIF